MMRVLSWQRFDIGLRLVLCGGPLLVCVFSLAEFPEPSGWWMLGVGVGMIGFIFVASAVGIVATRGAVWLVVAPFWVVRIRIDDIASISVVDVRPSEDFGGWGIKGSSRRRGLLLAAAGHRAVRMARPNGQVFLVTAEDPERVAGVLRRTASMPGAP